MIPSRPGKVRLGVVCSCLSVKHAVSCLLRLRGSDESQAQFLGGLDEAG